MFKKVPNTKKSKIILSFQIAAGIVITTALILCAVVNRVTAASNLHQTNVSTPSSNCVFVQVDGSFDNATKEAILARINEIRLEAYNEGLVSSYVPIKWSSDLEQIAMVRAAEGALGGLTLAHNRPNGNSCFNCRFSGGQSSNNEVLAWGSSSILGNINQWYREKDAYVNNTGGETGHYVALISVSNKYCGLANFGGCGAGEFCGGSGLDETKDDVSKYTGQIIEVAKSKIAEGSAELTGSDSCNFKGGTEEYYVTVDMSYANSFCYYHDNVKLYDPSATWTSSNTSVATVNSSGVLTGGSATGSTTLTYTSSYVTISKTVSITKKDMSKADVTLSQTSYTYNGSACTPSVTKVVLDGTTLSSGSYTVSYANNINAGTATVTIAAKSGDATYTGSCEVTFKINKAVPAYTMNVHDLVYTGSAQSLRFITITDTSTATCYYNKDGGNTYSTACSATDVGTYTVKYWIYPKDSTNYTSEMSSYTVKIDYAEQGAPTVTSQDLTYTGSAQSLGSVAPGSGGGTVTYSTSLNGTYSASVPVGTNIGTYTVYYKIAPLTNYKEYQGSYTVKINPKSQGTPSVSNSPLTYTGSAQSLGYVTPGTGGGTVTYSSSSNGTYSSTVPKQINAGTYTVYYKIAGLANYQERTGYYTVTINKAAQAAPTVNNAALTYTGSAQSLGSVTPKVSGGTVTYSTSANGTYTSAVPARTNSGSYDVYYKITGLANYSDYSGSYKITINKAVQQAPTVNNTARTYTGSAIALGSVTPKVSGGTVTYSSLLNGTYSSVVPSQTNAGTYTIYYKITGLANYQDYSGSYTFTINKATQGAPAISNNPVIYTGNSISLGRVTPANSGVSVTYSMTSAGTYSSAVPTRVNAGTYTVYYKITGSNYVERTGSYSFTINKKSQSAPAVTRPTLTYNGNPQALGSVTKSAGGNAVTYCLDENGTYTSTVPSRTNAGTYTVYYKISGLANYQDYSGQYSVTISKADQPAPTISNADMNYNGQARQLGSVTPKISSTVTYSLSRYGTYLASLTATVCGEYTVYYRIAGNNNYNAYEGSYKIRILGSDQGAPVVNVPSALTYTGASQSLGSVTGGSGSSTVTYSLTGQEGSYSSVLPAAVNAGNYTVYYTVNGAAGYNPYSGSYNVTIAKASQSAPYISNASVPFNGSGVSLGRVTPSNTGTSVSYSLNGSTYSASVPTATSAGTYKVYYKITGANYYDYTGSYDVTVLAGSYSLSGVAHVQDYGDRNGVFTASTGTLRLGTRGQSKRLERITINFVNDTGYSGGMEYRVHVQNIGWMDWVPAGQMAGTSGKGLRLEGIEIRLTGELAQHYSVQYCAHIQDYGDNQGWVRDGALAGTTGESKRVEEINVKLVPLDASSSMSVCYRVHRQDYGWESNWAVNGAESGTVGQSKRLEGIEIHLSGNQYSGGIMYRTHVQDYGWQGYVGNEEMSGTSGESKRLEGIQIYLTGEMAEHYDIYYRVHCQDFGWLGWARNGEMSGTSGMSKRLEAIQIVLVPRGGAAPSATYMGVTQQYNEHCLVG